MMFEEMRNRLAACFFYALAGNQLKEAYGILIAMVTSEFITWDEYGWWCKVGMAPGWTFYDLAQK